MAGEQLVGTDGKRLIESATGKPYVYASGACGCCGASDCSGCGADHPQLGIVVSGVSACNGYYFDPGPPYTCRRYEWLTPAPNGSFEATYGPLEFLVSGWDGNGWTTPSVGRVRVTEYSGAPVCTAQTNQYEIAVKYQIMCKALPPPTNPIYRNIQCVLFDGLGDATVFSNAVGLVLCGSDNLVFIPNPPNNNCIYVGALEPSASFGTTSSSRIQLIW